MPHSDNHATHREVELLDTLRSFGGSARTSNLAEALNVSEETIRRTVKALAKSGLVQRVHGGVYLSNSEALSPVGARISTRSAEKARVAEKAAELIPNGSCIFLDVGSTTVYLAECLRNHRDLTVVTNSLQVGQIFLNSGNTRVFMAGGQLSLVEAGTFGPDTMAFVERFNIDTAVISIDGFDDASGFLLSSPAEADLARMVSSHARRTIVITDNIKFGQSAPIIACDPMDVDIIVTDKAPGKSFQACLQKWEIELITPSKDKKEKP